jgi:hypothetical protein
LLWRQARQLIFTLEPLQRPRRNLRRPSLSTGFDQGRLAFGIKNMTERDI